mgnify:CR=1 FL=1
MNPTSLLKALAALTIALGAGAAAQAQVGMAHWPVQARPVTLIYPTQAVSRPQSFGPFIALGVDF